MKPTTLYKWTRNSKVYHIANKRVDKKQQNGLELKNDYSNTWT